MTEGAGGQAETVLVEAVGATLVITINRPVQRNSVNAAVAAGIARALDQLDDSATLRVGVLRGAGGCFSAGLDLKAFARGESASVPGRGFAGIVEAPPRKPLIAAVEGWALGGGFEVVLACDLVVGDRTARFGLPEVGRGLAARGGGALRLPHRLPRAIALEVLLSGQPLSAERAAQFGLLNRIAPDGQALAVALELAELVGGNAPVSVQATKRVALESAAWSASVAFERQREYFDPVFASADAREGSAAFRERRAPVWTGR